MIVVQDKKKSYNLETCFYLKQLQGFCRRKLKDCRSPQIFSNIIEKCGNTFWILQGYLEDQGHWALEKIDEFSK